MSTYGTVEAYRGISPTVHPNVVDDTPALGDRIESEFFATFNLSSATSPDTDIDVPNFEIIIPTAGVWRLGFNAFVRHTGGYARLKVTDTANNTVNRMVVTSGSGSTTLIQVDMNRETTVTTTGMTRYKLRAAYDSNASTVLIQASSITGTLTDPDNISLMWAQRIN